MKRFVCVLLTPVLLATWTIAQKKDQGNPEQTLLEMERKWAAAALKSDAAAVEDMLADSWSSINAEGKVVTRAQSLDKMKKSKLTKSEVSELKVRMVGNNTAVVTGVWTGAGTDEKGQKFDTTERWTDVFANQGGKWRCVASQNTAIKK